MAVLMGKPLPVAAAIGRTARTLALLLLLWMVNIAA
jgi:hypothetical protein